MGVSRRRARWPDLVDSKASSSRPSAVDACVPHAVGGVRRRSHRMAVRRFRRAALCPGIRLRPSPATFVETRVTERLARDSARAWGVSPPPDAGSRSARSQVIFLIRMSTRSHTTSVALPGSPEAVFAALHTPSAIRRGWHASRAIVIPEPDGIWMAALGRRRRRARLSNGCAAGGVRSSATDGAGRLQVPLSRGRAALAADSRVGSSSSQRLLARGSA